MQHRHWNSRDARRPTSRSSYRNFRRGGGFNRKPYRPMLHRKEEIFMKAGRLAAKYLVSEGLLPPSSIRPKWEKDYRFDHEFRRRGRDYRRNYGNGDDYDERRRRRRRKRGNDGYESDWGKERRRWKRRDWGYGDAVEGKNDFCKNRRRRFRERRARSDEIDGLEMDNWDGVDDYGWKAGSSRARKEQLQSEVVDGDDMMSYESGEVRSDDDVVPFADEGGSKNGNDLLEQCRVVEVPTKPRSLLAQRSWTMDAGGVSLNNSGEVPTGYAIDLNKMVSEDSSESDGEGQMDTSDGLKGKILCEMSEVSKEMDTSDDLKGKSLCEMSEGNKEMDISDELEGKSLCEDFDVVESYYRRKDVDRLLNLCSFTNVPTKPRTSFPRRSSKIDQFFPNEANRIVETASEVPKVIVKEDVVGGFSSNSRMNQTDTSKGKELTICSIMPIQLVEESVEQWHELVQSPEFFGLSGQIVNASEKIQSLRQSLKPEIERLPVDKEMITGSVADQEKSVHDESSPKSEPEFNIKMEVEKHIQPNLFKVCDLNLPPPDTIEVQDDLVLDCLHTSMPVSEASRELPGGFDCMMGNTPKNTNVYCRLSGGLIIPVLHPENDSSTVSNAYDSLKPKNETRYSSMVNLIENGDLHCAYSGCSLGISEFHQTGILDSPLPPSDLNNLKTGMGISGAEVL